MIKLQAIAFIHAENLAHNVEILQTMVKPAEIIAMVKADAYGHGIGIVVPILKELGVERFAVAGPHEAIEAANAGAKWILILGTIAPGEIPILENLTEKTQISLAINNGPYYREIAGEIPHNIQFHLMVDTGMHRHGIPWNDTREIQQLFKTLKSRISGIMTHFATAADNKDIYILQKERFLNVLKAINPSHLRNLMIHTANTSASALDPDMRFHAVRLGIGLYGYAEVKWLRERLKPVMEVQTQITDIRTIPPGDGTSYGWQFVATKPIKAATAAIGYADGYKRALSGKTWAGINGRTARQIGAIAMDYTIFDVSEIPDVKVGDWVIIIGEWEEGHMWADTLADIVGTIPYEILVSIGKRVKRVMVR